MAYDFPNVPAPDLSSLAGQNFGSQQILEYTSGETPPTPANQEAVCAAVDPTAGVPLLTLKVWDRTTKAWLP